MDATTDLTDGVVEAQPAAPGAAGADPLDHERILREFRVRFAAAKEHQSDWRDEARSLYDLVAGRQWDPVDEAKMKDELRPLVTFNVAGKFLDAVQGLQINNRQDIRYFPREPGDSQVNEMLTGAVDWARDLCDMADEETDAFFDAILTGMGWMEGFIAADADPAGWPAGERRDPLEMYWDPAARKKNLADGKWIIRVRYFDRDEYDAMFPGDGDMETPELSEVEIDDDPIVELIHLPQDYQRSSSSPTHRRGKVPVAHYEWSVRESAWDVAADGLGQQTFSESEWAAVQPMLDAKAVSYQATRRQRKAYYRAFISAGGVKEAAPSPYQAGFTFHAITGKRDRNKNTWYGIGRAILDPQRWVNKFFSSLLHTIMSNAKGGLIAEEGAFTDARKAEAEWAKPNSITYVAEGVIRDGRLQNKDPARYPEGLDRLMQFSLSALPETSGLNMELMGLADRVQAGVVEAQRKQSAMAIIAWAFDAMRRYYRSMGRQLATYVADYLPEGTLVRVMGEQGAQYVPLAKDRLALTYDVIVDEAPTSTNMKERVWLLLEKMIPQLLQAGLAVPPDVLDYSPLPADLSQKWKQMLQPTPEQQAEQQQQKQAAEQQFMAEIKKTVAEAMRAEADAELKQAQTVKTAAEAGAALAGGATTGRVN